MDEFTKAYIECALWSSTDDNGEPLDLNLSIEDIAPDAMATIENDCEDFQKSCGEQLSRWYGYGEDAGRAGHDFWLTRNRHGAGFWDRWNGGEEEKLGRELTGMAHGYGECNLYVGDDGKVYVSC